MHSFAAVRRRRQPAEMLVGCVQATAALPFLEAASPRFAIVFAGTGTRDKPAGELLTALSGVTVLRTDERGTIEIITEGRTLAIKTER
ncbi:MAG: hypothetical protein ACM3S0_17080 [Acidobacteriota bacterium]